MRETPSPLTGYIDGAWLPRRGRVLTRETPGRSDEVAARWHPAHAADARAALDGSARAFMAWSQEPVNRRADALADLADAIERETEDFATLVVRESGKTFREARAEVTA